ncbi:MAG: tetratricopeptide repeat protein [Candidatus Omnitrophica bacterium]|nr:tetratricopeptide repeat protein [Candidatus Omnitrophota bacterium]MDD5238244.1 tetratricopeptide repeat protein [Candidatus Omnitrophota bacterium]
MSQSSDLTELRIKLDEAITYGSKEAAVKIANEGLKEAKARNLPGELEYFQGQIEMLKENYASAIEHFDAAIKYNPKDGGSYNDRALCMVELGIIDEAFDYFDKGILAEPDYANIYHNKGWLLNNIGRHKDAIACFKKALQLEPGRPVTYDNLADALFNLGDYQGALESYKKVLELLNLGCCGEIRKEIVIKIKEIEKKLATHHRE